MDVKELEKGYSWLAATCMTHQALIVISKMCFIFYIENVVHYSGTEAPLQSSEEEKKNKNKTNHKLTINTV